MSNRSKVLIVGGAGYIGSTMCAWLLDQGQDVWILDDLSTGHKELVQRLGPISGFTQARAGDTQIVEPLLAREKFDCVMHFASSALVAESVEKPELYYENNVLQTQALLRSMKATGTKRFIFSSTCAIFGDPGEKVERINEDTPKNPINPYGATKLEVEGLLAKAAKEDGLHSIALRYFNAAGAEPKGRVGEWHVHETHLVPNLLKGALKKQPVQIFGTDFPTPDGSAIRDYVHVWDLAAAHAAAMTRLMKRLMAKLADKPASPQGSFEAFNLGSGNGFSVKQMVDACERAIGHKLEVVHRPRRAGDPPRLIADSSRARAELGFAPSPDSHEKIFASAWKWEQGLGAIHGK